MHELLRIPGNFGFKWISASPDDITTEASASRVEAYVEKMGKSKSRETTNCYICKMGVGRRRLLARGV